MFILIRWLFLKWARSNGIVTCDIACWFAHCVYIGNLISALFDKMVGHVGPIHLPHVWVCAQSVPNSILACNPKMYLAELFMRLKNKQDRNLFSETALWSIGFVVMTRPPKIPNFEQHVNLQHWWKFEPPKLNYAKIEISNIPRPQ